MSLATRCNACGTVFRVVQDQLKVSEGWVRCGRCNEVFNALEGLFDLERDAPPDGSTDPPPLPAFTSAARSDAEPTGDGRHAPTSDPSDRIDAERPGARHGDLGSTPATRVSERDRLEFPDARFDPESGSLDNITAPADEAPVGSTEDAGPADIAPEFVRQAQARARWQGPAARTAIGVLSLVLLATLVVQGAHHFRDTVAARWPLTKPVLVTWCGIVGCTIESPRRIEEMSVESTALTRADGPGAFNLAVTLRNRGTVLNALPAVELSLTDTAERLIARRVLLPQDFAAAPRAVEPGAESALQLGLNTDSARVAGYTVEIFYP
jgi:predicted Zn finger-like uncharacterized protein